MAVKAGTAYVEVEFDPDSIRRLRRDVVANGKAISKSWGDADNGLIDFDRAAQKVNKTMSGGPFGLFDSIGNVGYALLKMGGFAQDATDNLGKFASEGEQAGGTMATFGSTIGEAAVAAAPLIGILAAVGAALLVLPALAAAATFALVALLDVVTTLAAGVAALAGPLTIATGLLGGLGAAFAYVATQSFKNKATMKDQKDALLALHVAQQTYNEDVAKYGKNATTTERALIALHKAQDAYDTASQGTALHIGEIQEKFGELVKTLSSDFRPELEKLAGAALTALNYLDRIAKLPLKQAFRSLSTEGVRLISKFVYGVANVLKKPFRLAIQLAFGTGGENAQRAITSWWDSLTGYLFGYSNRHPVKLGDHVIGFTTTQVAGALQPIVDWFNRQRFIKTGLRWSKEIIDGIIHGPSGKNFAKWAGAVFADAGDKAGQAFKASLTAEVTGLLPDLGKWFRDHTLVPGIDSHPIFEAFDALVTYAKADWHDILGYIAAHIPHPNIDVGKWLGKVEGIWNTITGYITKHIPHPNIDVGGWLGKVRGIWDTIRGYVGKHIPHPNIDVAGWLSKVEGIWDQIVSYIESHVPHPSINLPGPSLNPTHYLPHTGGIVTPRGMQGYAGGGMVVGGIAGRDSVPALLTPGEVVLNEAQQRRLLHGMSGASEVHVHNYFGTREVNELIDTRVEIRERRTAKRFKAGRTH